MGATPDYEKLGAFYLGKLRDASGSKTTDNLLLYDSKDLVTHAVCVGMTGSGKTGLCIDLLEEAAIDGVPAIAIDPKGDIGNLLLQFPQLRPEDFQPWVEPGESPDQQAELWKTGLGQWGEAPERIARLREAADFAIYTPGSNAGIPLSVLKSFDPPGEAVIEDNEAMRDRVNATATAVLSLINVDSEPGKGREHILLANIFDRTWRDGKSLTIEALIATIQHPPFVKVGVMDVESFYPSKDRFELAMALNNLLASPGFDVWLEGEPLDIGRLLHTPEGKPRISILSISHLSDTERMFFVTLVLNELLSWVRSQSGTTSLRAIFYMDEIFGYFPPVANPPSKKPLLTLLKQARAFGVGVVLATQNPVDLDYKGLANTGTWWIGRLQTERDKQRLVDGLAGALGETGASAAQKRVHVDFDRGEIDRMLSGLGKRVFLMNNINDAHPVLFESRWALSYLRGPMTRAQIKAVMQNRTPAPAQPTSTAKTKPATTSQSSRPAVPPEVPQAFIPIRSNPGNIVYHPTLLGAVDLRFTDTKSKIDVPKSAVFLTPMQDDAMPVEWDESTEANIDPNDLEKQPAAENADYATLPAPALKAKSYTAWQKDLVNWIFGNECLTLYSSPSLKMQSTPDETEGQFRARLQQSQREQRDQQVEKLRAKYGPKLQTLQDRLLRAQQAVERERQQSMSGTMTAALDIGVSVLGAMFGGRRSSYTSAARQAARGVGRYTKDSGDVGRAEELEHNAQSELDALNQQFQNEVAAVQSNLAANVELQQVSIKPKKTNIQVRLLTLAWAPYTTDGKPAW